MSTGKKRGVLAQTRDWIGRQVDSVIDRIVGPCLPNIDEGIGGETLERLFVDDDIQPVVVTVGG
jgi:hypothetical protein